MNENNLISSQNDIPKIDEKTDIKVKTVIPKGFSKSGRVWRFATNGALQTKASWDKKKLHRQKQIRVKEMQIQLTEAKQARKRIEENKARRVQNELKSAKIRDGNKLKKMSKKQLRNIKKTRIDKNGNLEIVNAYAK